MPMSEARKAYQKAYYERNKARLLERQRERNAAHYQANKEKHRAKAIAWQEANPDRMAELKRRYRERHRDRLNAQRKAYYEANRELELAQRRTAKLRRYGLTREQFAAMLADQKGACLICLQQMALPVVDHDHETGKVRGLLCRMCNSALGLLQDSPDILRRAARYLTRSSSGATSTPNRKRSSKPSPNED